MNTTSATMNRARVQLPERNQTEWRPVALDGLLPTDHRSRVVWAYKAVRQRMATDEAKARYKDRPSIAEFPNAECRNRGLHQFRVGGLEKVKTVTLWYALTFNLMRMMNLGCIE